MLSGINPYNLVFFNTDYVGLNNKVISQIIEKIIINFNNSFLPFSKDVLFDSLLVLYIVNNIQTVCTI